MNVKALTKFFLSNTAMLASMLVTLTRLASLFVPVRAVVDGAIAAFEVGMVKPTHYGKLVRWWMRLLPFVYASLTAKLATAVLDLALWRSEYLATLLTRAFNAAVMVVAFFTAKLAPSLRYFRWLSCKGFSAVLAGAFNFSVGWMVFATDMRAVPFAKATLATKSSASTIIFGYFSSALFAHGMWHLNDTKVSLGIDRSGAGTTAVNTRPGFAIPEVFSASWAGCINSARILLAFATTKSSVWLNGCATLFTSGLHKRKPPVARSIGRMFRTLQWQQEAGFTIA